MVIIRKWVVVLASIAIPKLGYGINVAYIEPGDPKDRFTATVTNFALASAKNLGWTLDIMYGNKQSATEIQLAKDIVGKKEADGSNYYKYAIIANEKLVGPELLKILDAGGVKTFITNIGLDAAQKATFGTPRDKFKNWLGSFVPEDSLAGELLTKKLVSGAQDRRLMITPGTEMVALAGNRVTPSSVEREKGLAKAITEYPDVKLAKTLYTEWEMKKSYEMMKTYLTLAPKTKLIWAINTPVAIGAIRAGEELKRTFGKDIFAIGFDWSIDAINMIKQGKMVGSVGGNFMATGWLLVLIYDYENGVDFLPEALEPTFPLSVLERNNVEEYLAKFGTENWSKINFKSYSKTETQSDKYDFSIETLLSNAK